MGGIEKMDIEQYVDKVLISKEELQKKAKELAKEITKDYEGEDMLLVGILRAAVVFLADLAREISMPVALDFMAVSI